MNENEGFYRNADEENSVYSNLDSEDLNCVRIAVAQLLFQARKPWIEGMEGAFSGIGLKDGLNFEELSNENLDKTIDDIYFINESLRKIIPSLLRGDFDEIRLAMWRSIRARPLRSENLFCFMTTTLFSPLERESLTSAIALFKILPSLDLWWIEEITEATRSFFGVPKVKKGDEFLKELPFHILENAITSKKVKPSISGKKWTKYCQRAWRIGSGSEDISRYLSIIQLLVNERLLQGCASSDPSIREMLAGLVKGGVSTKYLDVLPPKRMPSLHYPSKASTGSVIIHGTFAWTLDWWLPSGDFFKFLKSNLCSDLYEKGREFSWSGNFLGKNLEIAGARFSRWSLQKGKTRYLNKVISHSYGADVCARAICQGTRVKEVIYLSAPATYHVRKSIYKVSKVVDIRLFFDLVLWAANEIQRLPQRRGANKSIILWQSPFDHSVTHDELKWKSENLLNRI